MQRFTYLAAFCSIFLCRYAVEAAAARHDFKDALSKSLLFYEAQRSGRLPDRDVPWRGDSALQDGHDVGRDLTGGWYDAGDFMKFNFPMAYSTTNLLWGLIKFQDGYAAAGQLSKMRNVVKWPLDYFLKCWDASHSTYYGQVGKMNLDHDFWGRPEEMTMNRPAYKLTTTHPGSDLAGETAAALAAGYLAFKDTDHAYATTLLDAAKTLYAFADQHHGLYDQAIPDAHEAYASSGFQDELCWGAAWLHKATGDATYHNKAVSALQRAGTDTNEFSWDDKSMGCVVLLHDAEPNGSVKKQEYAGYITSFLNKYRHGQGGVTITPCGLSFETKWGSLPAAMNAALIALVAAQQGIDASGNRAWALSQANYVLGDNKQGNSFVVGYGHNPPTHPHHASSSCRDPPAPCDWADFDKAGPNAHVLYGALVGGPDQHDNYIDVRSDYVQNEVACDYNAGFQSSLAGIVALESGGHLPDSQPACPHADPANHGTNQATTQAPVNHVTTHAPATHVTTQAPQQGADLDCTSFGSSRHHSTSSGYYPDPSQGGNMDANDHALQTLQDFLEGTASYVSVAMASSFSYGTPLCIPELNHQYNRVIVFKVVDSAGDLHGYSNINICARDQNSANAAILNGALTLVFQ